MKCTTSTELPWSLCGCAARLMSDRRWDWTRLRAEQGSSPEVRGQGWMRGPPCQTRWRLQREFCSVPRNQRASPPMSVSFCDPTYSSVKAPHWLIVVRISQKGFEVVQGQGYVLCWRGGKKRVDVWTAAMSEETQKYVFLSLNLDHTKHF